MKRALSPKLVFAMATSVNVCHVQRISWPIQVDIFLRLGLRQPHKNVLVETLSISPCPKILVIAPGLLSTFGFFHE
jgi:hypothetical protein